jgi:hypothetical protein
MKLAGIVAALLWDFNHEIILILIYNYGSLFMSQYSRLIFLQHFNTIFYGLADNNNFVLSFIYRGYLFQVFTAPFTFQNFNFEIIKPKICNLHLD